MHADRTVAADDQQACRQALARRLLLRKAITPAPTGRVTAWAKGITPAPAARRIAPCAEEHCGTAPSPARSGRAQATASRRT
jgi:hypothetical protein